MFNIHLLPLQQRGMFQTLIFFHSIFRWLILLALLLAIYTGYKGYRHNMVFSKKANAIRHWAATIAHIQLMMGMILYTQSPTIKYFWKNFQQASQNKDALFFAMIHIGLMLAAIVVVTIGSASAKRKNSDREKFKTMMVWFSIALLIILVAIPWPFSPLANRPYLPHF